MRKKFMMAGTIGALGLSAFALGTSTFAANPHFEGMREGFCSGSKAGMFSGEKKEEMMKKFASSSDMEAFRSAILVAMTNNDYKAFVAAHTKYNITPRITNAQFTAMIGQRAKQEKIRTALNNGDYTTWKTLNKDTPILQKITTEAQFIQLKEMRHHQEQAKTIGKNLGLRGSKADAMKMRMKMKMGIQGNTGSLEKGKQIGKGKNENMTTTSKKN